MMDKNLIPRHVGIIMDGNGRWAKQRLLPRQAGHKVGVEVFKDIVRHANAIGIEYITFYAFSTENWKRPKAEIEMIIHLLKKYLDEAKFHKDENIRTRFIGDLSAFGDEVMQQMLECEEETRYFTGINVNIAVNYGGKDEIIHAVKSIARDLNSGHISIDEINEDALSRRLYTKNQPDVDVIIRPSGEYRLSNFLIWQSAYAEYVFMDILWPDFKSSDFDNAIEEYIKRNRRFGGL